MQPAARLQAAIELLDEIIVAARDNGPAADALARKFFAARRYAGSKDRRAIREHVWDAIRRFGERPESGRSAFAALAAEDSNFANLLDGSGYGPAALKDDEPRASGGKIPQWILPLLNDFIDGKEQDALLDRAPLDIRVNQIKARAEDVHVKLPEADLLAASGQALRLPTGFPIDSHPLTESGEIFIQDLGSQLIAEAGQVQSGMTVLDLCAGAGGKTLALASEMQGEGRLIASDTNRARLDQLGPRAARAGAAAMIETKLLNPKRELESLGDIESSCDVVLVDAPCSGSGTWRRNPETRWRLTPARLELLALEQARLMEIASGLVRQGGCLVYAVCSLIDREGQQQIAEFLSRHSGWKLSAIANSAGRALGGGIMLTPAHDGTDGFFFARLEKL